MRRCSGSCSRGFCWVAPSRCLISLRSHGVIQSSRRRTLQTIHGQTLEVRPVWLEDPLPGDPTSAAIAFSNKTINLLTTTQEESCKPGSIIVEVSQMFVHDSLMAAVAAFSQPTLSSDYPVTTESIGIHRNRQSTPGVAVFIIPAVFVVLALLFVGVMNNRTLTLPTRGISHAAAPVPTEASARAFTKPPEPSVPPATPPKVCCSDVPPCSLCYIYLELYITATEAPPSLLVSVRSG